MNNGWRTGLWAAVMLFTGACVEPYLPPAISRDPRLLVVDGFLVENDSTKIRISRTQGLDSPLSSVGESNALVEILGLNGDRFVLNEKANGLYLAPPLNLDLTQQYKLRILTQDDVEYQSEYVTIKQSALIDSLTKTELPEHDHLGFYIYSHDPANNARYYYWTYDETWMYTSLDYSRYYFENGEILPRKLSNEIRDCYKTVYNNNFFLTSTAGLAEDVVYRFPLIEMEQWQRKFYYAYSMLVRQYALTEDAYTYYSLIKQNSENLGTLFDPIPSQPTSNVHCVTDPSISAIGFFSATTVQSKRIFFTRQEINGPSISYDRDNQYSPTGYEGCLTWVIPPEDMIEKNLKGLLIIDKVFDRVTFELSGYIVTVDECLDCRFMGGSLTRPDYWR